MIRDTSAGLQVSVGRAGFDIDLGRANGDKLTAQRAISKLELRRSEDALEEAQIELEHARIEAGLGTKELELELGTKQQSLGRQQEIVHDLPRQVAALQIQSPVDGQVGQLLIAQRATVAANPPVLTVVDLGAFELEICVAGNVAKRIELVGTLPAELRQNQRLPARILIEERPNEVERGAFADVSGGNYAYFVIDDIAERRPTKIGETSFDSVELLDGDAIVILGAEELGDNQRVRIVD